MGRGLNAQRAVDLYLELQAENNWSKEDAWKGIALLLLSCKIWRDRRWKTFHDVVVYRESNDFRAGKTGPNAVLRRGEALSALLASELGIERAALCRTIGKYWSQPEVSTLQPHNLVGNAFRSLVAEALALHGSPGIEIEEEVNPNVEFPGFPFPTRSKNPRIDIVARRGKKTVALISTRWRFRHDRVDVLAEAQEYATASRRIFPDCRFFAVVGEFSPPRLEKVLDGCPPASKHGPLTATIHFKPELVTEGLGLNGRLMELKSLEWLIDSTHDW